MKCPEYWFIISALTEYGIYAFKCYVNWASLSCERTNRFLGQVSNVCQCNSTNSKEINSSRRPSASFVRLGCFGLGPAALFEVCSLLVFPITRDTRICTKISTGGVLRKNSMHRLFTLSVKVFGVRSLRTLPRDLENFESFRWHIYIASL